MNSMNQPQPTHRSLTGVVTKLVGDGATYGFINDEIFFPQTKVVSGGPASVGDQVFAECEYSAQLPIKWNATSVKILNKAAVGSQNQTASASDRAQQDLMNQQQQQSFNQGPPVAVTYQQHRQQRQQRQMLDTDNRSQNNDNKPMVQPPQFINEPPPTRLLDQNQGDFFAPGVGASGGFSHQNQPPLQMQQQDGGTQPFQQQAPMDGANFTFTSQPGSAFVQNQFLPPPFLPQQAPPPLLPQSQHLLPHTQNNNQSPSNQNQRNNLHNKGPGNRFNNMDNKNDRQQNRNRNQNRNNDNSKFDRMRSGDRESPADRSRGNNSSRDRSTGRGGKKDGPSRPSPPPHSSARSTSSSDRGVKSARRHYEPQNIPKTRIMTNMNAYNMKQRCPSSVHVPSDLKDIVVNKHFRLDIKNIPKPLRFIIEETESGKPTAKKNEASKATPVEKTIDSDQPAETPTEKGLTSEEADLTSKKEQQEEATDKSSELKAQEQPTPPSSKSDIRMNHKYGVKVILMSIPESDAIYRKVFGPELDSYTNDTKSRSRLDEAISILCNKGSNNGHSLIGGKFDPVLDGFVEGKNNPFERHGRHPDLIATCKRVVLEQTGLDLGPCRSWNHLSTFIYNNKSDYFTPKASIEYSFIYMPQIWTLLKENLDRNIAIPSALSNDASSTAEQPDASMQVSQDLPLEQEPPKEEGDDEKEMDVEKEDTETEKTVLQLATQESSLETPSSSFSASSIYELKRDDLKLELDKRGTEYKPSAKKADLIVLLEEAMKKDKDGLSSPLESQEAAPTDERPDGGVQLEEGEVLENDPSEDSDGKESGIEPESEAGKRKAADVDESNAKRVCIGLEKEEGDEQNGKDKKVELITEAFFVKSREEQQLSLVSLYDASQVSRHDQFELSVASTILKESLIQHLSEYILTTLVEANRQNLSTHPSSGSSLAQNTQESTNGSDTNNNTSRSSPAKNSSQSDSKLSLREYPVNRYINLAFSYFDSNHMGHVYSDDLNKLFNNTDLTLSKRALISLIGDNDKFNYRTLADLSTKLPATYIYEFPDQFRKLPDSGPPEVGSTSKTVEYKGVVYDIEKLTQEVKDAETLRVSMVDRFNYAIENSDKQAEEIHVLEVSQKSLSRAIKAQNDEICDLKRERDSIKRKFETLRKGIKGSISSLSDLIKEDK